MVVRCSTMRSLKYNNLSADKLLVERARIVGEVRMARKSLLDWFFLPPTKGDAIRATHDELMLDLAHIDMRLKKCGCVADLEEA